MLTKKLALYRVMKIAVEALEAEIKDEVLSLGKSQEAEGVKVTYRKGVSKVDYQAAAIALEVSTEGFESMKVDYTAAVKAAKLDPSQLEPFTMTGEHSVSIKLFSHE
jgi:hypothetical protein